MFVFHLFVWRIYIPAWRLLHGLQTSFSKSIALFSHVLFHRFHCDWNNAKNCLQDPDHWITSLKKSLFLLKFLRQLDIYFFLFSQSCIKTDNSDTLVALFIYYPLLTQGDHTHNIHNIMILASVVYYYITYGVASIVSVAGLCWNIQLPL